MMQGEKKTALQNKLSYTKVPEETCALGYGKVWVQSLEG